MQAFDTPFDKLQPQGLPHAASPQMRRGGRLWLAGAWAAALLGGCAVYPETTSTSSYYSSGYVVSDPGRYSDWNGWEQPIPVIETRTVYPTAAVIWAPNTYRYHRATPRPYPYPRQVQRPSVGNRPHWQHDGRRPHMEGNRPEVWGNRPGQTRPVPSRPAGQMAARPDRGDRPRNNDEMRPTQFRTQNPYRDSGADTPWRRPRLQPQQ